MILVDQEFDPAIGIETIVEHPRNARRGDDAAVDESVSTNGFYGGIVVQRSTGYVIAGNTRYRVAKAQGAESIPGFYVDVDDEAAERIMLADNRTSDLAWYEDDQLIDLLAELASTDTGLTGTGYTQADIELLIGSTTIDDIPAVTPDEPVDLVGYRALMLPYPTEDYARIVAQIDQLREQLDMDSASDVVAYLVANALG